jgi:hypothetical protein
LLKAGQNLLLNNRLWHLRQIHSVGARTWELEAIGASTAALGMTRQMMAVQYGADLFIQQRQQGPYWHGHLQQDWVDTEHGPALNCQPTTWLDLLAVHTRHPPSSDLKNEFSWSYSRAAKYRQCPRAYYYHYYAAWEGWQPDAPEPVRRAYLLKNLTDLSRWVGTLVHDSLKFALARLKAGQPVTEGALLKRMRARAQADFDNSHSGRYRQQPNQLTGFQEHYYQINLAPSAWQAALAEAEQYLHTFMKSAFYADLRHQPVATFLHVEELRSFALAGTKLWVQLDLARRVGDTIFLYDWKTGPIDLEEWRQQLGVYGLYFQRTWPQIAAAKVSLQAVVYWLVEDRLIEFELDEQMLQEVQAAVESSMAQLQGLLLDARTNLAELRRFPMIDDLSVCQCCQFRELCER